MIKFRFLTWTSCHFFWSHFIQGGSIPEELVNLKKLSDLDLWEILVVFLPPSSDPSVGLGGSGPMTCYRWLIGPWRSLLDPFQMACLFMACKWELLTNLLTGMILPLRIIERWMNLYYAEILKMTPIFEGSGCLGGVEKHQHILPVKLDPFSGSTFVRIPGGVSSKQFLKAVVGRNPANQWICQIRSLCL